MEGVKNFTNIDTEDFEGMYGGEKQVIKKGKTKALPETIADHFANQLAIKILIRGGKDYLDDPSKPELLKKILGEVVAPPEKVEKEEKGLKSKTVKELKALAKKKGIDIEGLEKKPEIIEAIEAGPEKEEPEGEKGEEKEFPELKEGPKE